MTNSKVDGTLIKKICKDVINQLGFTKKRKLHLNLSNIFDEKFSAIGTVKNKLSSQTNGSVDQLNSLEQKEYKDNQDLVSAIVNGRCEEKYDFIFADMPLGGSRINGPTCINILRSLNKKGVCSFLMPSYWHSFKTNHGSAFSAVLRDCGYKVLSVINLPSDFLRPITGLQATLVFISEFDGIEETYFVNCSDKHLIDFLIKINKSGYGRVI